MEEDNPKPVDLDRNKSESIDLDAIIKQIREQDYVRCYCLTPSIESINSAEAIDEGRGYGIPIATFGHTRDKLVIHPGHFGFNYDYFWGSKRGGWSESSCWDKSETDDHKKEASRQLFQVAQHATKRNIDVWCVAPCGTCKGYLVSSAWRFDGKEFSDGVVLFVFVTTTPEDVNQP